MGERFSRWLPVFVLILVLFPVVSPLSGADVPRPSPKYEIKLVSGQQISLGSYRGKVVALLFVSTTCPHCKETCRLMNRLQNEYGPRGLQTVAVAFNQMARMLVPEFVQSAGVTFPVGYDDWDSVAGVLQRPTILQTYVPIMVFIDRKGLIRGQYLGDDKFFSDQEKNIRSMLEKLLKEPAAGRTAVPKSTAAGRKSAS